MDPSTGRLVRVESEEDALEQGLIPVTEAELRELQALPVEERKLWADARLIQLTSKLEVKRAEAREAEERRKVERQLAALRCKEGEKRARFNREERERRRARAARVQRRRGRG